MSKTNYTPQSAASVAASNAAFKRFAARLTELHKEQKAKEESQKPATDNRSQ